MDSYHSNDSHSMAPTTGIWCGEPVLTKHAYITYYSGYTYPHLVEFACRDGYVLHGPRIVRCGADGLWTGTPTCNKPGDKIPWWAPLIGIALFLPITLYALVKLYDRCLRYNLYGISSDRQDLTCEEQLVSSTDSHSNEADNEGEDSQNSAEAHLNRDIVVEDTDDNEMNETQN